ncbi:MAG: aminopeptidase P family protein [Erysipelotrichaceae bacterium]|nr:aminopeptidase P family protein [Erysipelotrichaceae bacterium]
MTTRRERIQALINENGFDGVLYATGANFQYLTESNDVYWQRCCMNNFIQSSPHNVPEAVVYMNKEGKVTILCTPQHRGTYKDTTIRSYMDQFEDELAPIIDGKKIGLGFNCGEWLKDTLKVVDPEIETVYAENMMDYIRCYKDENEIAQLRKMAEFTDDAIMYVATHMKEGMTQFEAEHMLMEYGFEHGMQDFSFPPTIGFKTRGTFTPEENFEFPRTSKLVPGTGIAFDIGFMNEGYCSDWGRTLYYGKAPEHVKKGYEALQAGQVAMVNSIVPYKTNINELYGMIEKEVVKRGFGDVLRYRDSGMLGHQIGIDCHEHPMLSKSVDFILKPGMVFCSEPKMMFEGETYMRVEDMILITETGAEFLSNFPRDMFEIDVCK